MLINNLLFLCVTYTKKCLFICQQKMQSVYLAAPYNALDLSLKTENDSFLPNVYFLNCCTVNYINTKSSISVSSEVGFDSG